MTQELPDEFLQLCRGVTNKRARTVIDHIIKHGYITTEELTSKYGYQHPPRAAGDVRDLGIPLETIQVTSADGRHIAAYRFGDLSQIRADKLAGRTTFSKNFKSALIKKYGSKCAITQQEFEARYLQIDHRIPYHIAGDIQHGDRNLDDYMLLSGSANRSKSWSCEHCENWNIYKDENICRSCYWAFPENYSHIAMEPIRRTDIIWRGTEVSSYDQLLESARQQNKTIQDYIKEILDYGQPDPDT